MNKIKQLVFCGLFFTFISACSSAYTGEKNDGEVDLSEFITALISKDQEKISEKYLNNSRSFTQHGRLNDEIFDFLYIPDEAANKKSINQIIKHNNYSLKIIWQNSSVFTVLLTSLENERNLSDIEFLKSQWMVGYIACEFEQKDGKLYLYQNVCFAETDGPFPQPYEF